MAVGAVAGLVWAAGFRGCMAAVAGPGSAVDRVGTFAGILLPGTVAGALLGRGEPWSWPPSCSTRALA